MTLKNEVQEFKVEEVLEVPGLYYVRNAVSHEFSKLLK